MNQNIVERHKRYNIRLFKRMAPIYDHVEFFVSHIREEVARIDLPKGSKSLMSLAAPARNQSLSQKEVSRL